MNIYIPKPIVAIAGLAALAFAAYMAYEEGPPMYRYLMKFEAM